MTGRLERTTILERLRRLFGGKPPRIQAAALPWRCKDGVVEVMLVTSRDTGRWVLPKGWPEGDETLDRTAVREAMEEAGIEGTISAEIGRYIYGKQMSSGLRSRCEVAVFPLEVKREAKRWAEKKQRTRRWFAPEEAALLVIEPDLSRIIGTFEGNPRKIAA